MRVVWDPPKAKANLRRHGIRFADAEGALFDPHSITREDATVEGEQRFVSIGLDHVARVLVVVFAYRGENVRLISARRATRRERRQYEAGV